MDRKIYLGQSGRTSGPFNEEEIHKLRVSGEIKNYSWIWRDGASAWDPIDPPPPPITGSTREAPGLKKLLKGEMRVLCFDRTGIIKGSMASAHAGGCEIHCESTDRDAPTFSTQAPLKLNILSEDSGHSVNVEGLLTRAIRMKNKWIYQVQWKEIPAL